MSDILAIMIPVLVVDVVNPVLLATVVLALTTDRPIALSLAVICGHTLAYFVAGVLVLVGAADLLSSYLAPLIDWFQNPTVWDYVISLVLGLLMILVAWRWKIAPPDSSETETEQIQVGVVRAFVFGAILNFIGIPFAIPYFAFVGNLFRLNDEAARMGYLVAYNLLYAVPFLMLPVAMIVFGKSVLPLLNRINATIEKYAAYIMPVLIGLIGLGLVADALSFFASGTGLI
ncbi:GAP family protein [Shimia biformata]|uniref:GAP family protein n=1 Tax=Shimia biformata TaxID=1294299 RepID=UPI001950C142|nr:GAP family protein [Shimia biformata]